MGLGSDLTSACLSMDTRGRKKAGLWDTAVSTVFHVMVRKGQSLSVVFKHYIKSKAA